MSSTEQANNKKRSRDDQEVIQPQPLKKEKNDKEECDDTEDERNDTEDERDDTEDERDDTEDECKPGLKKCKHTHVALFQNVQGVKELYPGLDLSNESEICEICECMCFCYEEDCKDCAEIIECNCNCHTGFLCNYNSSGLCEPYLDPVMCELSYQKYKSVKGENLVVSVKENQICKLDAVINQSIHGDFDRYTVKLTFQSTNDRLNMSEEKFEEVKRSIINQFKDKVDLEISRDVINNVLVDFEYCVTTTCIDCVIDCVVAGFMMKKSE